MFQIKVFVLVILFLLPLFFSAAIIDNQCEQKKELKVEDKFYS